MIKGGFVLLEFIFNIYNLYHRQLFGGIDYTMQTICLLNDSFPPQIDGVSNSVLNYAKHLNEGDSRAFVVTPSHPQAEDSKFSFSVVRYPSVAFSKMEGYMAGIPFSPEVARIAEQNDVSLLHSHCPIISTIMARMLRQIVDAPIVLTYHTKFDVDIENITNKKVLQLASKKAITHNINACNEVWAVSRGAGDNLRSLGYEGDYIVMPNGVDIDRGRVLDSEIKNATDGYDLPYDIPVYLYVGRMMWYKGIRLTIDALKKLSEKNKDFRMVFIGEGDDLDEIIAYTHKVKIKDKCIFTGAIRDRQTLKAWYCRADLFLFPSSYDTNGLVVREAAACSLGAVLIKDSCAAECVTDMQNGFLVEENSDSLFECLLSLYDNIDTIRNVGKRAGEEIYISWKTAVKTATERYEIVIDRYKSGYYTNSFTPSESYLKINGELMEILAKISSRWKNR